MFRRYDRHGIIRMIFPVEDDAKLRNNDRSLLFLMDGKRVLDIAVVVSFRSLTTAFVLSSFSKKEYRLSMYDDEHPWR